MSSCSLLYPRHMLPLSSIPSVNPRPKRSAAGASTTSPMDRSLSVTRTKQTISSIPHLLPSHKDLINGLVSVFHDRLDSQLLPSSAVVPPEVERYQNDDGSSHGCLFVYRGMDTSHIDFILASALRLSLPNNSSLLVTNLHGYLKTTTDAPHFLFELCQIAPAQFIFFLDLNHRKDLVLEVDYRKAFYEDSPLEACRKRFYERVPEAKPYEPSSLHFRCIQSPTSILALIKHEDGASERVEEIIRDCIASVAEEVLGIWIDTCVSGRRNVSDEEGDAIGKRDYIVKRNAIEMDLSSSMPALFGKEMADKVLSTIRAAHNI